jgi:choline dehydrogenase-like flavoprotein
MHSVPAPDSTSEKDPGRARPSVRFADDDVPEGSVVDGATLVANRTEAFDYVVVGSGAAGAVAAHVLAKAGFSVAIVEEGPWVKTRDFGDRAYETFERMARDAGTQMVEGRSYMPLLQGRCVGGSTVMNSAIAHRTPEDVLDDWARRFGLGGAINARILEPHFEALESELGAKLVSDGALGENNGLFLDAANSAGLEASRTHRYERGCEGSGQCATGCPHAAKQSMNVSYVPWALALGARLFHSCRVERVFFREDGRAAGVIAQSHDDERPTRSRFRLTLHGRRGVVVAASTIQTPNLLRRSGLRGHTIGRHFQCHPGFALAGVFDHPIAPSFGATQGAESLHFVRSDRFKLETLGIPPELAVMRFPGIGRDLMQQLGNFANLAIWAVVVRAEAEGTIRAGWGGRDKATLTLTRNDMERMRKGTAVLARTMFQAGAREVWPGIFGIPGILRSIDDVRLIDDVPADPRLFSTITTHLFGAARMGNDPATSVVAPNFETHEARALYVVDSSVFPTNLGVNPQHSIMAMSRLAATRIAADSGTGKTHGVAA